MNCKKARRLIPLLAGSDLERTNTDLVTRHLNSCPECQHEYEMSLLSLNSAKKWLAAETVGWDETEWIKTIQRALDQIEKRNGVLAPWPFTFKKGWALLMMAAAAFLLTLFIIHPSLVKDKLGEATAALSEETKPDVLSMKIISEETGLKINWFFHKDFELKEYKLEVMK
ncbi:MAG: hypothetical protein PVF22_07420 [Candidatus Aminicenantes bacterium]